MGSNIRNYLKCNEEEEEEKEENTHTRVLCSLDDSFFCDVYMGKEQNNKVTRLKGQVI